MADKSLLVIAYPELASRDFEFIQNIRRTHDDNYGVIMPHFTLVFPVANLNAEDFIAHVQQVSLTFNAFEFAVRYAVPVKDSFSPNTHLFLVPDEGNSQIHRLHDILYTGLLASALRLDVPFVPHITIGNFADSSACKAVADELNERKFVIPGRLTTLDIIENEPEQVRTLKRLSLL